MLFNIDENKFYEINLLEFQNILFNTAKQVESIDKAPELIQRWNDVLSNLYIESTQRVLNNQLAANGLNDGSIGQVFHKIISFDSFNIILHFNLNRSNDVIGSVPITPLPKEEFIGDSPFVNFEYTNSTSFTNKNTPVVAVIFPVETYRLLIIDGNHRISELLKEDATIISTKILNPQIAISLIPTCFEKAYYLFLQDIFFISIALADGSRCLSGDFKSYISLAESLVVS